jgi:hypothetical protein
MKKTKFFQFFKKNWNLIVDVALKIINAKTSKEKTNINL